MSIAHAADGTTAFSAALGTTVAPGYPASPAAGDMLVLVIGQKPSTANGGTVTTPSGWTLVGSITGAGGYATTLGADTGNTNLFVFSKVAVGTESGTLSVTVGVNNICWASMSRYTKASGVDWNVQMASGQQTVASTAWSALCTASPGGIQSGDMLVGAMCTPTDANTWSAGSVTATGATIAVGSPIVTSANSALGNQIGGGVFYGAVTAGHASVAPTVTGTASGSTNQQGPSVVVRLREVGPTTFAVQDWAGVTGSAWPAPWTTGTTPTGGATTEQSGFGRMVTGSAASYAFGSRISRQRGSTITDVVQRVRVRFPTLTEQGARIWARADTAMIGSDGYQMIASPTLNLWGVIVSNAFSDTTVIANQSFTFVANTWYVMELGVVGSTVKARLYDPAGAVPAFLSATDTVKTAAGSYGLGDFPGAVGSNFCEWDVWEARTAFNDVGVATATGSLVLTGSAAAVAPTAATGGLVLTGSAAAVAPTAATGGLVLTGAAAASGRATAAGSLVVTGSAAAGARPTATGALVLTGSAAAGAAMSATGALALTGSATAGAPAAATGALVLTGAGTGSLPASSSTGSLVLTGSAAAGAPAAATGALAITGTAAATAPSAAAGALALTGVASAKAPVVATGALVVTGTAAATAPGAAAGALVLTGTAAATAPGAAASGALVLTGAGTAQQPGGAAGTLTIAGTALSSGGTTVAGSLVLTGSASGSARGSATGALVLTGAAAAQAQGAAAGSLVVTGAIAVQAQGAASGSLVVTGTGTAQQPGGGLGALAITGSASSTASAPATGALAITGTAAASGRATATGSLTLTGATVARAVLAAVGALVVTGAASGGARSAASGAVLLTGVGSAAATSARKGGKISAGPRSHPGIIGGRPRSPGANLSVADRFVSSVSAGANRGGRLST